MICVPCRIGADEKDTRRKKVNKVDRHVAKIDGELVTCGGCDCQCRIPDNLQVALVGDTAVPVVAIPVPFPASLMAPVEENGSHDGVH